MYVLMDLNTNLVMKTSYNQCELFNIVYANRDKNLNVFSVSDLIKEG